MTFKSRPSVFGPPFVRSHRAGPTHRWFSPPRVFGFPLTRHTVLGCVGMIRPGVQGPSSPQSSSNLRSLQDLSHIVQIPTASPPPSNLPPARQSFPCNLTSLIARKTLWAGGSRRGAIRRDQPSKPSEVSSGFSRPYLPKALSLSQHDSNHFKSC